MDTLDDELLLRHILCRLPARTLACLECTCLLFHRPRAELHVASIVDEAARLLLEQRNDLHLVPPGPGFSKLRILSELEALSSPLTRTFSSGVHGHLDVSVGCTKDAEQRGGRTDGDASCVITKTMGEGGTQRNIGGGWGFTLQADRSWATAICGAVMRAGTHYCEFTILKDSGWGSGIILGVCRADWVATHDLRAAHTDAGWGISAATGLLRHAGESREWAGMEYIRKGETLGLLLEFGERRLTAFKDGRRLGVLPTAGACSNQKGWLRSCASSASRHRTHCSCAFSARCARAEVGAAPLPATADGTGWLGVDAERMFDSSAPLSWMVQLFYASDSVCLVDATHSSHVVARAYV